VVEGEESDRQRRLRFRRCRARPSVYEMCIPLIARAITMRWISLVPSKSV
jgi:hypothetical protein